MLRVETSNSIHTITNTLDLQYTLLRTFMNNYLHLFHIKTDKLFTVVKCCIYNNFGVHVFSGKKLKCSLQAFGTSLKLD